MSTEYLTKENRNGFTLLDTIYYDLLSYYSMYLWSILVLSRYTDTDTAVFYNTDTDIGIRNTDK
jgi:hypothetical protein